MPVSWQDDPETFRAAVIQAVLSMVQTDPQGFRDRIKPTVEHNSKSRCAATA